MASSKKILKETVDNFWSVALDRLLLNMSKSNYHAGSSAEH